MNEAWQHQLKFLIKRGEKKKKEKLKNKKKPVFLFSVPSYVKLVTAGISFMEVANLSVASFEFPDFNT